MDKIQILRKYIEVDCKNLLLVLSILSLFTGHVHTDSDDSYIYAIDNGMDELAGRSSFLRSPRVQPKPPVQKIPSSCHKMGLPGYPEFYLETFGSWNMKQCSDGMEYKAKLCSCVRKHPDPDPKTTLSLLKDLQRLLVGLTKLNTGQSTSLRSPQQRSDQTTPSSFQSLSTPWERKMINIGARPNAEFFPNNPRFPPKPQSQNPPSGGDSHEVINERPEQTPSTSTQPTSTLINTSKQPVRTQLPPSTPSLPPKQTAPVPVPIIIFPLFSRHTTQIKRPLPKTKSLVTPRTTTTATTTKSTTIVKSTTPKPQQITPKVATTTAVTTRRTTTENYVQKICEGCTFERGIGYVDDARDCNRYIMCYSTGIHDDIRADVRSCGVGKYWDQALLTCRPSAHVLCRTDKCKHMVDSYTYAYKGNCRAYWECHGGVSVGKCCPRGQSFIQGFGCTLARRCNATCLDQNIINVCNKSPVPGRRTMFRQTIPGHGLIDMHCATGTIFNQTACNCEYDTAKHHTTQVCNKEVDVHFTNAGLNDVSGNALHFGHENVTIKSGMACFQGDGAILIPRFSNAYIGDAIDIRIKFKLDSSKTKGRYQSLFYNGDCNMDPSVVVSANQNAIRFTLRSNNNETKTISTPYTYNYVWVDATFTLHNRRMSISLSGTESASAMFTGTIARSRCGLKIGWGEDYESFHGCIDKVSVAFCKGTDSDQ